MSLPHPILAIDHGAARIGLAITDPAGILAHPLTTVQNTGEPALTELAEIITQHQVKSIVIGLPLRMDGSTGTAVIKIRKFKKELVKFLKSPLPIEFVDERMTTIDAAQKLHQVGKNSKQQKSIIDQAAAVEILNQYLNSQINPFGLLDDPDQIN